jgi:hypothetical protein
MQIIEIHPLSEVALSQARRRQRVMWGTEGTAQSIDNPPAIFESTMSARAGFGART